MFQAEAELFSICHFPFSIFLDSVMAHMKKDPLMANGKWQMENDKWKIVRSLFLTKPGTAFPPKVSNLPSKLPRPEWHRQLAEESMFNNLIESTSHANEFKRRGSFLLFTTATYLVLFVITGVVSIYAYDAHMEARSTEIELLTFVPDPPPEAAPEIVKNT